MNARKLKLDKYGISGKRYKELCGFCEQYPEWKRAMAEFSYISSMQYDADKVSVGGGESDPTFEKAVKMSRFASNCQIIEETARAVDADLWAFLIKAICYEVPLTYLMEVEGMPISRSAFFDKRRYFFFLLDRAKNAISC